LFIRGEDTYLLPGGVGSSNADAGETLQVMAWLYRCRDGKTYRYIKLGGESHLRAEEVAQEAQAHANEMVLEAEKNGNFLRAAEAAKAAVEARARARSKDGYMIGGDDYGPSTWEAGDRVGVELSLSRVCGITFLKNGRPSKPEVAFGGIVGSVSMCPMCVLCNADDTAQLLPFLPPTSIE